MFVSRDSRTYRVPLGAGVLEEMDVYRLRFRNVSRHLAAGIAATMCLGVLLSGTGIRTAAAAVNVQSLMNQAIHDTNTVNTIVHHDQTSIVSGRNRFNVTASGAEDEVRNQEQDSEKVTVTAPGANGNLQTIHYSLDVIFIKGYTYYRSSVQQNQWKQKKGSTFTDPFKGKFVRQRTTISNPQGFAVGPFKLVGTSGGQTQVRAALSAKNTTGTYDLWISGGSKPYVVRTVVKAHSTKGTSFSETLRTDYGPFNKPVTIQPPIIAGST